MRIAFIYPPRFVNGKIPLLGQNRQFKYTHSREIKIYPLIPAYTVTLLQNAGHEVLFLDGINRGMTAQAFERRLNEFAPDVVIIETKTPIIQYHWKYIKTFKADNPDAKVILCGDHVTFFPEESINNSEVDFVVTGGDYDVSIRDLISFMTGKGELPKGIYRKVEGKVQGSGKPERVTELDALPFIDRELTGFRLYGEAYLYRPCAYILSGRGCGREGKETGGVCTFCVWQHAFWQRKAYLRSPKNVAEEIEMLVKKYKVYEIFDDNESGGLWSLEWLQGMAKEIETRGLKGKFVLSSNARAEDLTEEKCKVMKRIGYRLLKVGLESGNTETLRKIGKLETIEQIKENIKRAKGHGFKIMMTMMTGYPWETEKDVEKTYETAKELMLYKTRFGDSLQASIVMPYPGTPLYREAQNEGWLTEAGKDYEKMDMTHDILKSKVDNAVWCKKMWALHKQPLFLIKSFLSLRTIRDVKMAFRGIKSLLGHTKDY
ncbi:MAG: radical SAM protein [bacterium]